MKKFAEVVSIIGHPFVTIPVFVIILLFAQESPAAAALLSLLIIGGIFVPVSVRTWLGVRKGKYTNLDVSDQTQRQEWFVAITVMVIIVTIIIWLTNQQRSLVLGMTFSSIMMVLTKLINYRIKVSMHMTFHAFVSFMILYFYPVVGVLALLFLPLLAWSRLYLKRHYLNEVVVGTLLGSTFGALFWYFI